MKSLNKENRIHTITLLLAGLVLTSIFIVSIIQVFKLQKAGKNVVENLNETTDLRNLYVNLLELELKFNKVELSSQYIDSVKVLNEIIYDKININTKGYKAYKNTYDDLLILLKNYKQKNSKITSKQIINSFKKIKKERLIFINNHYNDVQEDISFYENKNTSFPIVLLLLTFVALSILIFSFFKMLKDKKDITQKSKIIDAILTNTNDIVNYYTPIFNNEGKVINFKINYVSDANSKISSFSTNEMIGKKITEVFPFLETESILERLIASYENQKYCEENIVLGEVNHYKERLIPVDEGLHVMVTEITDLVSKNKEIKEKSDILDAILNNTNDIAHFYKPIFDKNDTIVDFEIVYASKSNITLFNKKNTSIIGSKISELASFFKESGLINEIITSFKTQTFFQKNFIIPINKKDHHFTARFTPVKNGVQVLATEITEVINKQKALENLNVELILKNQVLSEAEAMAKLGSYVWYMKEDITHLSDNVYMIMGHEPQSFESSSSKFREFTHPDDLELYDQQVGDAFKEKKPVEFIFRIITKQNEIKYLYTNGAFKEKDGEEIMVGIIQDVSNRISDELKLKEQNIELIRRNQELDSFNRVASHDLQEPLRKIQMYLSRFNESEFNNLTERGKNYLDRIENGATRMRVLINNLLAFSRIDSKDYKFEEIDLNLVYYDVLQDLSEAIKESNAQITSDILPTVNAIPFLMEQLFTNLIGNAIKYRRNTVLPKIKVECNVVHNKQITQDFIKTYAYYHEIKIIDNGIGFSQKDSAKIFGLFERLHQKNEYSGTGIGLAICEKIILKHHGYIYANSVLNEGSVFTIYLPSGKLKHLPTSLN